MYITYLNLIQIVGNYFLTWPPEGIPTCREQQPQLLLSQCCAAGPLWPRGPASCQPPLGAASTARHTEPDLREHREGREGKKRWWRDFKRGMWRYFGLMKLQMAANVYIIKTVMSGPSRPCACRGGQPVVPASSRRARVLGNEPLVISIIFASQTPRSSGSDPETDVGTPSRRKTNFSKGSSRIDYRGGCLEEP